MVIVLVAIAQVKLNNRNRTKKSCDGNHGNNSNSKNAGSHYRNAGNLLEHYNSNMSKFQ